MSEIKSIQDLTKIICFYITKKNQMWKTRDDINILLV
jgi:hypothetical protein